MQQEEWTQNSYRETPSPSPIGRKSFTQQLGGRFISVEGIEGSGKTTLLNRLSEELEKRGFTLLLTREPGGVPIAEAIREVLLNPDHHGMDPMTESLLYAASRREHLMKKILPALGEGKLVLCDRYVDSSLAYQGHARGIGMDQVLALNQLAIGGLFPSLTLYLDLDPEIGLKRIYKDRGREINRLDMESISFHRKVREGYLILANREPGRIKVINASKSEEEVLDAAIQILLLHLKGDPSGLQ